MSGYNLNEKYIHKLEKEWDKDIEKDAKYWRENEAKLRAATSVETYEEFSAIVKACHLQPLTRKEMLETKKNITWNVIALPTAASNRDNAVAITTTDPILTTPSYPADFIQQWNKLDNLHRHQLLKLIPQEILQKFLQTDCPPAMLSDISQILQPTKNEAECIWQVQLLEILTTSARFELNMTFLSNKEKESYKAILTDLIGKKNFEEQVSKLCIKFNLD